MLIFEQQRYESKELVILDDSLDPSFPTPPTGENIRYFIQRGGTIPEKRNKLAELADGEIVWNLDSDDWSHPERMSFQVGRLLESNKAVTGFSSMYFFQPSTGKAAVYPPRRNYALGSSLCFFRSWGLLHRFPENKLIGEDNAFVYAAAELGQLDSVPRNDLMVARAHETNTSKKSMSSFKSVPTSQLPEEFLIAEGLEVLTNAH